MHLYSVYTPGFSTRQRRFSIRIRVGPLAKRRCKPLSINPMVVSFSHCIEHLDENNLSGGLGWERVVTDRNLPILGVFNADTVLPVLY